MLDKNLHWKYTAQKPKTVGDTTIIIMSIPAKT